MQALGPTANPYVKTCFHRENDPSGIKLLILTHSLGIDNTILTPMNTV